MPRLYELIQQNITTWRENGYSTDDYPAIAEILDYDILPETGSLRFLRAAQLRAPLGGEASNVLSIAEQRIQNEEKCIQPGVPFSMFRDNTFWVQIYESG
jgi:hypothetical protein